MARAHSGMRTRRAAVMRQSRPPPFMDGDAPVKANAVVARETEDDRWTITAAVMSAAHEHRTRLSQTTLLATWRGTVLPDQPAQSRQQRRECSHHCGHRQSTTPPAISQMAGRITNCAAICVRAGSAAPFIERSTGVYAVRSRGYLLRTRKSDISESRTTFCVFVRVFAGRDRRSSCARR